MFLFRRTVPGLAIHSYLIGDAAAKECAVLDPVRNASLYMDVARENGLTIKHIFETHVHADFVSGAVELKSLLGSDATIHCSGMGGAEWTPAYADHVVKDGDTVIMGALQFQAHHTPGHTPEHICWSVREKGQMKILFTGDFIFIGDVGRPDLLGEEKVRVLAHQLYESVFTRLSPFPDDVEVRPSHGAGSQCGKALGSAPASTLGIQKKENPALVKKEEAVWIRDLLRDMPVAPKYFPRMKRINVEGPPVIGDKVPALRELSPQETKKEVAKGALLLDVRTKEQFAGEHIPGSINIQQGPSLAAWAGAVLPDGVPLILVIGDAAAIKDVGQSLFLVGFDNVAGHLQGGIKAWRQAGFETRKLKTYTPVELAEKLKGKEAPRVLDVRTLAEWRSGHIHGALHIPVGEVHDALDRLPKDRQLAVICGHGQRASIVCSLLLRAGMDNIANVMGGMALWNEEKLPIE